MVKLVEGVRSIGAGSKFRLVSTWPASFKDTKLARNKKLDTIEMRRLHVGVQGKEPDTRQ